MRTTFVFSCHFEGGWPRGRPPTDATSTSVLGLKAPKAKPTNERGHPSHQEKQDAKKGSMYSFRGRSVSRSVGRLAHAFRQSCFSRRGAERGSRLLCAPFSFFPARCENPRNKQWKWSQLYGLACPLCPAGSNTVS